MFSGSRKFVLIGLFTLVLIAGVNFVWWINYDKTARLLEEQLVRRLTIVAALGSSSISPDAITALAEGDLEPYIELSDQLENLRRSDSLAELFLLDEDYAYLVTTQFDPSPRYFLADLNGPIIDSIFYGLSDQILLSPTYQSGKVFLKAAFAGIYDSFGRPVAVLGAEASLDYFDALIDLKENLYLSTLLSLGGGVLAGIILVLLQIRINRAENQAFLNQTQTFLGRMVAVVAHEIRNPLAIIRGSAERLKNKHDAPEAGFIIEETDRLNQIVTGYLEFAKGGKSILGTENRTKFGLHDLIRDIQTRLQTELGGTPIEWLTSIPSEGSLIEGYRNAVRQVIFNLALNGAQACQERKLPVRLGISVTESQSEVVIKISDHGGGMTSRQLKKAFTPFYTTKQRGSGLGLYLSQNIVKEMKGSLTAGSTNDGLTVRLTLPK